MVEGRWWGCGSAWDWAEPWWVAVRDVVCPLRDRWGVRVVAHRVWWWPGVVGCGRGGVRARGGGVVGLARGWASRGGRWSYQTACLVRAVGAVPRPAGGVFPGLRPVGARGHGFEGRGVSGVRMAMRATVKRYVPYPSGVDVRARELEITANHDQVRSVLSRLTDLSRAYRGLFAVSAAVLFLVNWRVQVIPAWVKPLVWILVIVFGILAAFRIRVVVQAESGVAIATEVEATVQTEDDDS